MKLGKTNSYSMKTNYPEIYSSLTTKNFFVVISSISGWGDGSTYGYTNVSLSYNTSSGVVSVNRSTSTSSGGSASANVTNWCLYYTSVPLP